MTAQEEQSAFDAIANAPAFPHWETIEYNIRPGMTILQYATFAAMQGLCSGLVSHKMPNEDGIALFAKTVATATIKLLAKEEE